MGETKTTSSTQHDEDDDNKTPDYFFEEFYANEEMGEQQDVTAEKAEIETAPPTQIAPFDDDGDIFGLTAGAGFEGSIDGIVDDALPEDVSELW